MKTIGTVVVPFFEGVQWQVASTAEGGGSERLPDSHPLKSNASGERGLPDGSSDVAQKLGVELHFQEVQDPGQFESAFETIIGARAQALVVLIDPLIVRYRGPIVELAKKTRLPTMYRFREFVDVGGLMAYGV